jgi:hypothetical protein
MKLPLFRLYKRICETRQRGIREERERRGEREIRT